MTDTTRSDDTGFIGRPLPQWYDDAKFGIFIHWGPYAVPCFAPVDDDMGELFAAGDWAAVFRSSPYTEWYLNSWSLPGSATEAHHAEVYGPEVTYADFVAEFRDRSAGVDVAHWAPLFSAAGARYVVPVTKHHDGFLMWRSGIANPHRDGWMAERDHVGELAAAVRAEGLRFGTYYSGGLDWTFTPPPIDSFASMIANVPKDPGYAEYAIAHVHELVERFAPDVLWNDIAWPFQLDPNDIFRHYYDRVPEGVVNDRFNLMAVRSGTLHADFSTPEYSTTPHGTGKWEVCRGIGRSFGYNRNETEATMPSVDELVWMVTDIVGRGGNLLLNVGPSADGQIPLGQAARLTGLGWWLRVNGDAIYGTRPHAEPTGVTSDGRQVRITVRDGATYLLVEGAPAGTVRFPGRAGLASVGAEVRMLGNDRVLPHTVQGDELLIELPDHLPPAPVTVFAVTG
ncbi:MAG: alpha-L-fucosidase [Ilumatobacteraceae bacterium]